MIEEHRGRRASAGICTSAAGTALAILFIPLPALPQVTGAPLPPGTVTLPTPSQQLTIGFGPINICPKGYLASQTALQNVHLVICDVKPAAMNRCAAQVGAYECGLDGDECCKKGTDNPCFPGAYACIDGSAARTACCMTR